MVYNYDQMTHLKSIETTCGAGIEPYPEGMFESNNVVEDTPFDISSFSTARPC